MFQTSYWQWKFKDNYINIYYKKHPNMQGDPLKNVSMMPPISDVST